MKTKIIVFLLISILLCHFLYAEVLKYQIRTQAVNVLTTATKLPTTPLVGRQYIMITNNDSTDIVYIGSSTVTTSGATIGTPLRPSEQYVGNWGSGVDLYGISNGDTAIVTIEEGK